ncbi:MAG TPA: hypothetical protein VEI02_09130 [Planctomycetota bacterium]|nr:hypothetical protein [Planctomycetota bacterium]
MPHVGSVVRAVVAGFIGTSTIAQTVHVVDDQPGPGVGFTDVQAAVDAAASGDVLLIHPGSYGTVVIDGKALTLQGVGALQASFPAFFPVLPFAAPAPPASFQIRNVPPGQRTIVQGLSLGAVDVGPSGSAPDGSRVDFVDVAVSGRLRINAAQVEVHRAAGLNVHVLNGKATFSSCTFSAPSSTQAWTAADGIAMAVGSSTPGVGANAVVRLYDTALQGGHGYILATLPGGADALRTYAGASASVYGASSIAGGLSIPIQGFVLPPGYAVNAAATGAVTVHGGTLSSGLPSPTFGPVTVAPAAFPSLAAIGPTGAGGTCTLSVSAPGTPGAPFLVGLAFDASPVELSAPFAGALILAGPSAVLWSGALDGFGQASIVFSATSWPPSLLHVPARLQAITFDAPIGLFRFGQPTLAMIAP